MSTVRPIPEGFHTVTPYLALENADRAIEFYKSAFGAAERFRMLAPDGRIAHAELQIGDSVVMVTEATQEPLTPSSMYLYVKDADAVFDRAISAGAQATTAMADMFWGDRFGRVTDPFGVRWGIATHTHDLSAEEISRRAAAAGKQTT